MTPYRPLRAARRSPPFSSPHPPERHGTKNLLAGILVVFGGSLVLWTMAYLAVAWVLS